MRLADDCTVAVTHVWRCQVCRVNLPNSNGKQAPAPSGHRSGLDKGKTTCRGHVVLEESYETTWWGRRLPSASPLQTPSAAVAGMHSCTYLGGVGLSLQRQTLYWFTVADETLRWCDQGGNEVMALPFYDVVDASTSGQGSITTGGGYMGGGVGFEAAVAGIFAATFMNEDTRRTRVDSTMRVTTRAAEGAFSFTTALPQRIYSDLAPLRVYKRSTEPAVTKTPESRLDETLQALERLAALYERGLLSAEEFEQQKQVLLGRAA